MKDYFDEDEYLEDIFGDEIKLGDKFVRFKNQFLVHEKNLLEFLLDENDLKLEER